IVTVATNRPCGGECAAGAAITGAAVGGAGLVLGAVIGTQLPGEQWEWVALERIRVRVAQQDAGRLWIGARLAF
ncbi:MAG: hypothetical protein ACREN5_04265, partial [Gemmatimonadales bacterium]